MKDYIDAIVLAGDRLASKSISGMNKSMLEIAGIPLLVYVVRAVEQVQRVRRIVIIGPAEQITSILTHHSNLLKQDKPIDVLEQKDNVYQNVMSAYTSTIEGYRQGLEREDRSVLDKPVLILPSDTPLISSAEIDEFLDNSDMDELDYCLGMTEKKHLTKFYPTVDKPGVMMSYLHLAEGSFRLNNLHLLRPFKVLNRIYIEKLYEHRYQKQILNILVIAWDFLRTEGFGFKPVYLYGLLELSVFFSYMNMNGLFEATRARVSLAEMTKYACILLKTRIAIVETSAGGCATDIDNPEDFETISRRFDEWREMLKSKPVQ